MHSQLLFLLLLLLLLLSCSRHAEWRVPHIRV
jgi:hypothetical protein